MILWCQNNVSDTCVFDVPSIISFVAESKWLCERKIREAGVLLARRVPEFYVEDYQRNPMVIIVVAILWKSLLTVKRRLNVERVPGTGAYNLRTSRLKNHDSNLHTIPTKGLFLYIDY